MASHFYAYLSRMKWIRRWGLMQSTRPENDMEHALQTALIAHALALLGRRRYGRQADPERVLALAVYHDAAEVLTGDLPTPVKYATPELRSAYRLVEEAAARRLVRMAPAELRSDYRAYLIPPQDEAYRLVKAADRLAAYIKCLEERQAGNREFLAAEKSIRASIEALNLPEVQDFLRECVPSFTLSLDEISREEDEA